MALYTKCILDDVCEEDGVRVSVMSRHTLDDGLTADTRLEGKYHEWMKSLAPPETLVGDYYKRNLSWNEFEKRYKEYLKKNEVARGVKNLANMATTMNITLLCVEQMPEKCHRRLLAEECKKYEPGLSVVIR